MADAIAEILQKVIAQGVVSTQEPLPKDFERGAILRDVRTLEEKVVYDFKQFYSLDQARALVRSVAQPILRHLDDALANQVVDFSQRLIQPNITLNRSETEQRRIRSAAEIKPVLYKIKQGEMLLREGERVSDLHLLKLQALESETQPEHFFLGVLGAAGLMFGLLVVSYVLFFSRILQVWENPTKSIILMACVFLFFLFAAQIMGSFLAMAIRSSHYAIPGTSAVFLVPLVAAPMIICVFLRLPAALPFGW